MTVLGFSNYVQGKKIKLPKQDLLRKNYLRVINVKVSDCLLLLDGFDKTRLMILLKVLFDHLVYERSPLIRRASWISLGMIVTRLAWMAHKLVSSNNPTRYASAAS